MQRHFATFAAALVVVCFLTVGTAFAQTISGEITGAVLDPAGQVVAGADVTLVNQETGEQRTIKSDNSGLFTFPVLQPGIYTVSVQSKGFKEYVKRDVHLSAAERLSTGNLRLQVGAVTEIVDVTATGASVQTQSSERSALLDRSDINSLMTPGRDVLALVRILPGVVKDGEGGQQLGTESAGAVSGTREVGNSISVDGVNGNPRGGGNRFDTPLNMEAVGEVKVLLNNYQPEYGQSAGAIVNIVSKSGTKTFHGEGYYFNRNEAYNANSTINKHTVSTQFPNGIPRGRTRFNTIGYNFGGPIYWPGKFNSDKSKLFFFFSQEYWPTEQPVNKFFMMPTALEKSGDFSQSFEGVDNGALIGTPTAKVTLKETKNCGTGAQNCLLDPTHVNPAFINQTGLALLNILPIGNATPLGQSSGGGLYNFILQGTRKQPVNQQLLRLDYNINDKWHLAFHGMNMSNNQSGPTATGIPSAAQWGIPFFYDTPARNAGVNLTTTINPSIVNEFTFGYADWKETTGTVNASDLAKLQRATTNVNVGQFLPSANPLNIVPRATFGGGNNKGTGPGFGLGGNAPQINFDNRFPFNNNTGNWEFSDGLTKVWGRHNFKVGLYGQKGHYVQHPIGNVFDGQFGFDTGNKINTLDTGYAYANALLGNYNSYQEGTRTVYAPKWKLLEWYAQDNWKITSRLTLDYGARFSYDFPTTLDPNAGVTLVPGRYDPTQVPALYQPVALSSLTAAQKALCNNDASKRCAQNPNNPADVKPSAAIGTFVAPWNFTGSVINTDANYPHALRNSNGVLIAPRLGVTFDPFGDGKTAIHAGAGVFYNLREDGGVVGDFATTAPIISSSTLSFGNISSFVNCSGFNNCTGVPGSPLLGPQDTKITPINHKIASTFSANFGIQHELGFSTILDIAYVGTWGRHLEVTPNLNAVPYLSEFLPQNLDPSASPTTFLQKSAQYGPTGVTQIANKSDNFFRPSFMGYGSVDVRQYTGTSNYNALQTSLTRRFTKDLQFGVSYTWSKTLSYADTGATGTAGSIAMYQNPRFWNYGLASIDRTHNLVFHYLYRLPNASHLWNNGFVRAALDDWELSGISEYVSGSPQSVSISISGVNLTGGGDGARILAFGDPLASNSRSTWQYLNPSVWALPPVGVIPSASMPGITRRVTYRGPGTQNWDMRLAKTFNITERVHIQLGGEAYNIFNHPSYTSVNNTATFDNQAGTLNQANPATATVFGFGQFTGERGARQLQLVGKIVF
jgi:hypothetical protein